MAIYKNREVSVIGPNNMANSPETINIRYKDGSHENVAVKDVYFTDQEKKDLIKKHPSKYEDVRVASAADVESVQAGVTPPSDPSYKELAEREALVRKQQELSTKNVELAKKEVDKHSVKAPWVK